MSNIEEEGQKRGPAGIIQRISKKVHSAKEFYRDLRNLEVLLSTKCCGV